MTDEAQHGRAGPTTTSYEETVAKRLAVGDRFVPDRSIDDARGHGWSWTLLVHDFTARGDYSSVVSDEPGSSWTERFSPDEPVWLAVPPDRAS